MPSNPLKSFKCSICGWSVPKKYLKHGKFEERIGALRRHYAKHHPGVWGNPFDIATVGEGAALAVGAGGVALGAKKLGLIGRKQSLTNPVYDYDQWTDDDDEEDIDIMKHKSRKDKKRKRVKVRSRGNPSTASEAIVDDDEDELLFELLKERRRKKEEKEEDTEGVSGGGGFMILLLVVGAGVGIWYLASKREEAVAEYPFMLGVDNG